MLIQNGDASVTSSIFENNAAADFGGGVHITGSTGAAKHWKLDGVTFSLNAARKGGGLSAVPLLHKMSKHASGAGAPTALFRTGAMHNADLAVPELDAIISSSAGGAYTFDDLSVAWPSQDGVSNPDTPAEDVLLAMARFPDKTGWWDYVTVTIRWVKGATSYDTIAAIRTVNGAETLLDSIEITDPGHEVGVTSFDALGRPTKGWGFDSAVTDSAIFVCTMDAVFKFDLEANTFSAFPLCAPTNGGHSAGVAFTAIAVHFDQGTLPISPRNFPS